MLKNCSPPSWTRLPFLLFNLERRKRGGVIPHYALPRRKTKCTTAPFFSSYFKVFFFFFTEMGETKYTPGSNDQLAQVTPFKTKIFPNYSSEYFFSKKIILKSLCWLMNCWVTQKAGELFEKDLKRQDAIVGWRVKTKGGGDLKTTFCCGVVWPSLNCNIAVCIHIIDSTRFSIERESSRCRRRRRAWLLKRVTIVTN